MRRENAGQPVRGILGNVSFESQSVYVSNVRVALTGTEP
jgi:hypothetical protein